MNKDNLELLYYKDPFAIRTISGKYINVFNPDPDTIEIQDIAHALSYKCRFGGHLNTFYSVGAHSISVAMCVPDELRLEGLLHDASEAYLTDLPTPIKKGLHDFKSVEDNLMKVISEKFGFNYPLSEEVKAADKLQLEREFKEYHLNKTGLFISPNYIKQCFLDIYYRTKNYRQWI